MLRLTVRFLLRILFRYRAYNTDSLNTQGPVIMIPNHVSWIDWLLLGAVLNDDWKFVTSSVVANQNFLFRLVMTGKRCFPVDVASPYAVRRMAEYLKSGGRLVLFAEGRITSSGTLGKLYDGTGFLVSNTRAKIVLAYLRGAERSIFATQTGWKKFFSEITVHFSSVLIPPEFGKISSQIARRKYTDWVYRKMTEYRFNVEMAFGPKTIIEAVEEKSKMISKKIILEDALRMSMTHSRLMIASELMAHVLMKKIIVEEKRIGVLLPNVNAMPATLLSLWRLGKTPAILNYTTGPAIMNSCIQLANLKTVITSVKFVENAKIDIRGLEKTKFIFIEDVKKEIGVVLKFITFIRRNFFFRMIPKIKADDSAVVLFTSGSESLPKGVVLTHRNILSNIRQVISVTDMEDGDRMFNALPLFHSFGLTVGLLLPLVRGCYTFLYISPLHYRLVPAIIYDRDCTIVLGTNTFLTGYAQRAHPYDFRKVRCLFAGAEKLQESTVNTWAKKFGVRVLEGYGATECSPCISVNTTLAPKVGSAGRILPGMDYKLEKIEGIEDGGRLFVRGPNIMSGYLNPDADAAFKALGGWYDTGDIVTADDEGFIFISGRVKRFAKVSGEMVSLTAVEDALNKAFSKYAPRCRIAVMAVKDERKGEALLLVTNELRMTLDEVREKLRENGFPNLAIPREIRIVKEIPRLGSGKLDYRKLQTLINETK